MFKVSGVNLLVNVDGYIGYRSISLSILPSWLRFANIPPSCKASGKFLQIGSLGAYLFFPAGHHPFWVS